MRYLLSVIQYVPNPASGEFVNVGAIVGRDGTNDWRLRTAGISERIRGFGSAGSLTAVYEFMADIGDRIAAEGSEKWLMDLSQGQRSIARVTRPAPVLADSAEAALAYVFQGDYPLIQGG